jgi:DNA topoisomerase VI subunit B
LFVVCNSNVVVSSLPSEPAEACPGPHPEGDDEIRTMAEAIMDKVVNQLLNEATEIVLKEN